MPTPTTFEGLVNAIIGIIGIIIPLIFSFLFLYLIWRLIDVWILNVGDESKRTEGKQLVIAAIIVFVLMVGSWGIIEIIRNTLFP